MSLGRNSLLLASVVDVPGFAVVVVLDIDSLEAVLGSEVVEDSEVVKGSDVVKDSDVVKGSEAVEDSEVVKDSVLEEVVDISDEIVVDTSDEVVDVLAGLSEVLVELGTGAGFFLYRISLEPAPQYS